MAEEEKKDEVAEAPETDTKEDAPAEAPKEEVKEEKEEGTEVEVPAKFKKLVEEVESMSVLELNELVKVLEKKFGVSAQAVAVAAPGAGGDGGGDEAQDSFTVELTSMGDQKIAVIKVVKEVLGLGLKEAKDMVESSNPKIKSGVSKEEAEKVKQALEAAGAKAELK